MNTLIGIQVARAIISGDVSIARTLASGIYHWSVPEARAIVGACNHANKVFDSHLNAESFLWDK